MSQPPKGLKENDEDSLQPSTPKYRMSNLKPYVYVPLVADAATIRVVNLHPSSDFSRELEVTIHTTILLPTDKPEYEAISYTWGSPEDPAEIVVTPDHATETDPTPGLYKLSITKNLDVALRHLRLEDADRLLWIDAICIDQSNDEEKSVQVGKMGRIYAQAARVVAWLGPEEILDDPLGSGLGGGPDSVVAGTALAIETLKEVSQKVEVDWSMHRVSPRTADDAEWARPYDPLPYDTRIVRSLDCLLRKSWFERLWIWQEIRLGNASSILVCGSSSISWSDFRGPLLLIHRRWVRADLVPDGFLERVEAVLNLCDYVSRHDGTQLERLIFSTQHCKFTDSRDRLYALFGLLGKNDSELGLVTDYTKTAEEVFEQVLLRSIERQESLCLMVHCNLAPEGSRNRKLPTWVPDWEREGPHLAYVGSRILNASLTTVCYCRQSGPGELVVTGVRVAALRGLSSPATAKDISPRDLIRSLAPKDVLEGNYAAGESMMDAFCKTLQLGMFSDIFLPLFEGHLRLKPVRELVREIVMDLENPVSGNATGPTKILQRVHSLLTKQRFFTTEEGYIGIGPQRLRDGDHIAILLGFEFAMVLRPTDQNTWEVVGPCYLHGFMNGEAFIGRLPADVDPVLYYDEKTTMRWHAFVNRTTGDITIEDPRIGELPERWGTVPHADDNCWIKFKDLETGRTIWQDPRLRPDALRERGVKLEDFVLI